MMVIKIFCAFCGSMFDANLNYGCLHRETHTRLCSQSCYNYMDHFIKGGTTPPSEKETNK